MGRKLTRKEIYKEVRKASVSRGRSWSPDNGPKRWVYEDVLELSWSFGVFSHWGEGTDVASLYPLPLVTFGLGHNLGRNNLLQLRAVPSEKYRSWLFPAAVGWMHQPQEGAWAEDHISYCGEIVDSCATGSRMDSQCAKEVDDLQRGCSRSHLFLNGRWVVSLTCLKFHIIIFVFCPNASLRSVSKGSSWNFLYKSQVYVIVYHF